jgi:DNA polymerase-3 subunit delta'
MRGVAGHTVAKSRLTRTVAADLVGHAYLFTGPEGIGKTRLALAFARLLMCQQPDLQTGDSCDECGNCRKIAHGNHPDVTLVEAEEGKRLLGVDLVREMVVRTANLQPSESKWRVFILPHVERMTANTANALLKTLEEPPPGVVLILTSSDAESLPPTIISRCRLINMHPVAEMDIETLLVDHYQLARDEARVLATLAQGRPGWAVRAHDHPELREERGQWLAEFTRLAYAGRALRLRIATAMTRDGDVARQVLELWTLWWRDVVLAASGAPQLIGEGSTTEREAERLGKAITRDQAESFLHALLAARESLDQNVSARLVFDVLMFDLPYVPPASGDTG